MHSEIKCSSYVEIVETLVHLPRGPNGTEYFKAELIPLGIIDVSKEIVFPTRNKNFV